MLISTALLLDSNIRNMLLRQNCLWRWDSVIRVIKDYEMLSYNEGFTSD
jgi:hypothetical protein